MFRILVGEDAGALVGGELAFGVVRHSRGLKGTAGDIAAVTACGMA